MAKGIPLESREAQQRQSFNKLMDVIKKQKKMKGEIKNRYNGRIEISLKRESNPYLIEQNNEMMFQMDLENKANPSDKVHSK
jgi:acylphosphatase